ncbi:CHY zinc finger protein [Aspergillus fumigatus Af293]
MSHKDLTRLLGDFFEPYSHHIGRMDSTSGLGAPDGLSRHASSTNGHPSVTSAELATAQPQNSTVVASLSDVPNRSVPKQRAKCRFFTSQKGCRAGDACPYIHDLADAKRKNTQPGTQVQAGSANEVEDSQNSLQGVATDVRNLSISDTKEVKAVPQAGAKSGFHAGQRPISKAESSSPREFQINQLRRRFRPKETTDTSGTSLTIEMAPSDPDFPFELDTLQCILHVPLSYPGQGRPTLKVINPNMERAFQASVERGFDDIVDSTLRTGGRGTLLSWMNNLDRHLERLLTTTERGPTLKFVPNVGSREVQEHRAPEQVRVSHTDAPATERKPVPKQTSSVTNVSRAYTTEEKAQAERRRAVETKQIEARLGRMPLFQKSPDELSFVIPVQPSKVERLPVSLRPIKTVKLLVPRLYPLEPSSIELQGVRSPEAQSVEVGFSKWVKANAQLNLMSQINYLTSNMHTLVTTALESASEPKLEPKQEPTTSSADLPDNPAPSGSNNLTFEMVDKPHIRVIPRPPEWSARDTDEGSEVSDFSTSEDSFTDEDGDDEDGGAPVPDMPAPTSERGVALSFPYLELYGIELLELVGLYITVKCDRCKEHLDVRNIPQVKDKSDALAPKVETCKKCTNTMSLGFRRQLMHAHSTRAGYLDLDGCTVVDLLPSSFIPTCAECSTTFPVPGVVAVRGESATASCRQCHRKMVFKIPEVKFLIVGSAAFTSRDRVPQRKKPKETLGIVAGQELPRRGRCMHYGKSYRWFRFSCCAKVFPCDKCHDAATDHPNEHANRMICGFCSREQVYRPENCGICRAVLVGKAGSGFWEGGKGTRNKVLMSRKDPRKYKRLGATKPGGSSSSKK